MSAWLAAKIIGRATRASFYLDRAGVRFFRPEVHRYYRDKRTQQERFRVAELFPGYLFIRPEGPLEYAKAKNAIGVAYILGGFSGDRFVPREIPAEWVETLERAGPMVVGRKIAFKKGDKVKLAEAIAGIGDAILEVVGVDKAGKIIINVELFGKLNAVRVSPDRLELAG